MILGIGTDLLDQRRIAAILQRHPNRLIQRIATPTEQQALATKTDLVCEVAKIFAVKEAVAKALGTGFRNGLTFQHIEWSRGPLGQPQVLLRGVAAALAKAKAGERAFKIDISLADEYPYIQVFCILSTL